MTSISESFSDNRRRIAILGQGIVGLSCALKTYEEVGRDVQITVIADKPWQETTTVGSGGLWEPYELSGTLDEKIFEWGKIAFDHFLALHNSSECGIAGVQLMTSYELFTDDDRPATDPIWKEIVLDYCVLHREELQKMNLPPKYIEGHRFTTFVIDQNYYLKWLYEKLSTMGISFVERKVLSLNELSGSYDVVINCTGLGSGALLNDSLVYPIRGQVLRLKAPWIKNVWSFGSNYLIPQIDTVVVGGTAQRDNWDESVSMEDTDRILDSVCAIFPSLRSAPIHKIWVGLRPGRTSLRLESEQFISNKGNTPIHVIHCYGHGGSGVTLAMGTAHDVVLNHLLPFLASL